MVTSPRLTGFPMTESDILHRFTFSEAAVRGETVVLKDSLQTLLSNTHYPAPIKQLMAELSAAAALLSATLKFKGEMSLQIQGKGPVSYAVVSADHNLQYRGVARWDENATDLPEDFSELCAQSVLAITITPDEGERYQGVVALDKPSLAECIEAYFYQSEQLLTKVYLFTETHKLAQAAGLFLQIMPQSSEATETGEAHDFHHFVALADTLTAEEILSLDVQTLLHRLYHEHDIQLYDGKPVKFACTCSKERSATALQNIDKTELLNIVAQEGSVKMNCQYCHSEYHFDAIDVEAIHSGNNPGSAGSVSH